MRTGEDFFGPLTPKMRAAADLRLKHPEWTYQEIAEETGYHDGGKVSEALSRPQVRFYMQRALDAAGAEVEQAARAIAEAHQAEKVSYFPDKKGRVVETRRDPDHAMRLKAAELNLRVRGALRDPGEEGQTNITAIFAKITQAVRDRGLPLEGDA